MKFYLLAKELCGEKGSVLSKSVASEMLTMLEWKITQPRILIWDGAQPC